MNLRTELKRHLPESVIKIIRKIRSFRQKTSSENFITPPKNLHQLRDQSMKWLQSQRPTVNATLDCLLLKHLYGVDLKDATEEAHWILSFQDSRDGLFKNGAPSSWASLTAKALTVLSLYKIPLSKPIRLSSSALSIFLEKLTRDESWRGVSLSKTCEDLRNYHVMLRYRRDHQNSDEASLWLEASAQMLKQRLPLLFSERNSDPSIYELLEVCDEETFALPSVMNTLVDSLIAFQNRLGGFGTSWNSGAKTDLTALRALFLLSKKTEYRKTDVANCFRQAFSAVLATYRGDGSWADRRLDRHGELEATWLRSFALAHCVHALGSSSPAGFSAQDTPGFQSL